MPTPEDADLIQRTTTAMLDALPAGVADNARVCFAALGMLVGVLAAATPNPAEALAAVNRVARGVIDGSLLD